MCTGFMLQLEFLDIRTFLRISIPTSSTLVISEQSSIKHFIDFSELEFKSLASLLFSSFLEELCCSSRFSAFCSTFSSELWRRH